MHTVRRINPLLRRCITMLGLGLLINLIVAWTLVLVPRLSAEAHLSVQQYLNPSYEGRYTSMYVAEQQWLGVHERQYYLTRRARTRPVKKRVSVYWTWLPWEKPVISMEEGNRLFEVFEPLNPDNAIISNVRVGFPVLTLESDLLIDDSAALANGSFATEARHGFIGRVDGSVGNFKPGVWSHAQHLLFPYRPIWTGLLINTGFYAVLTCCIAWLARHVRHSRRMHRGRCPICAYELQHDFRCGCSECGWRRVENRSRVE
ncbi:MAG: hypothetical protein JJ916_07355 [Phycisphaerales bacterium]|nr:hypothetical protein [Phycisphaerales bacterium]